ncbi:primosomal protein [Janibacter cremeus]|uniref:primosomal protein n=1 Tax=Janibacter cremeus TaxID=1285192 RepID=UPI0023F63ED7|nr:primosomal protein [Janibacter cremeus]WEV79137.1 primosomal protein [Janibacter cremeus]
MSDPRPALNQLIAALERHLEASSQRRGEDDPTVVAAYEDLADAFEAYDDALHDATGEMTPLVVVDEQFMVDDADSDDEDYDDDEDDQSYGGLDDEDYDEDDDR